MGNDTPALVIDYYQVKYPETIITAETSYADLGLEGEDRVISVIELESSLGITPDPHDAKGIYTIGQAIVLIESKTANPPA